MNEWTFIVSDRRTQERVTSQVYSYSVVTIVAVNCVGVRNRGWINLSRDYTQKYVEEDKIWGQKKWLRSEVRQTHRLNIREKQFSNRFNYIFQSCFEVSHILIFFWCCLWLRVVFVLSDKDIQSQTRTQPVNE